MEIIQVGLTYYKSPLNLGLEVRDKVRFKAWELFNIMEALLLSFKMDGTRSKECDCLLVAESGPHMTAG